MPKDLLYATYGDDCLHWFDLLQHSIIHPSIELHLLQREIIQSNNTSAAFFCAQDFDKQRHLMQQVVLKGQSPLYLYLFARHIPHADIKALEAALITLARNNVEGADQALCEFARYVTGANIVKLQKAVVRSQSPHWAYYFLKHVKGAQLKPFKALLLACNKPRYLYWLAQQPSTTKRELAKIETVLIAAKSFQYIRLLAENVPNANIPRLEQCVLESGNAAEIKKFAQSVKKATSNGLAILF